jgi:hypothetical protein
MGVLDDAIREHLELKRQHGAPAQEVAKQEQEALGAPAGPPPEAPQEPEQAVEPEAGEPEALEPEPASEPEPAAEVESSDEVLAPVEEQLAEEAEPATEPPPVDEPLHDPIDEAFAEPAGGDTPPRGFEAVEPEPAPEGGDGDDEHDMLEDTPDFLEETPEHDRLWFEQKPPRDFDFDE